MSMVVTNFPATDESLADVMSFVEDIMEKHDVPARVAMQISVALEEIFVNIAHYAYHGTTGPASVGIDVEESSLTMEFIDSGVPFNPLEKPDPDITLSAEDRSIGGLGIFMVKKSMTSVNYEYKDGQNILTLFKQWG